VNGLLTVLPRYWLSSANVAVTVYAPAGSAGVIEQLAEPEASVVPEQDSAPIVNTTALPGTGFELASVSRAESVAGSWKSVVVAPV